MRTEQLIDRLSSQLSATSAAAFSSRLHGGLLCGVGASLLVLGIAYGVRADLRDALFSASFWMKWGYAAVLAAAAYLLFIRMSRPTLTAGSLPWLLPIPLLILLGLSAGILLELPPAARSNAWLGHSALYCPWNIGFLSMPIFGALCFTLRRVAAPTQLHWAGFAAGVLSGAVAAFIYGFYCTESSVPFVTTWYTVGVLLPAVCGAAFGPRLLRWG